MENIDVTQVLKDAENSLRDFISQVLGNEFGPDWINKSGLTQERIKQAEDRKKTEKKQQTFGSANESLIYYLNLFDLQIILEKHWSAIFSGVFGDLKEMRLFLTRIGEFRDTDSHRRELLPFQKHLLIGYAGEIRSKIVLHRNKLEKVEDYFPKIESVRDSFGKIWKQGDFSCHTDLIIRPGEEVAFVITAYDPLGEELEYQLNAGFIHNSRKSNWQKDNTLTVKITEEDIGSSFEVTLYIRSKRKHHARSGTDDMAIFKYSVLPNRE